MNSSDLQPWQAQAIHAAVRPALAYLHRLRERMNRRGFPDNDPLYRLICRAYNSLHALFVETDYLSCKGGVGRPAKEQRSGRPGAPFY